MPNPPDYWRIDLMFRPKHGTVCVEGNTKSALSAGKERRRKMDAKTAKRNERRDLERLAQAIARWERQGQEWAAEGDAEMARVHAKDAADLRKVAEAVKNGDYEIARDRVQRLDTIVRDQVPCRLYNRLFDLG